MKHYYAFDWTKGIGCYDMESMQPIGAISALFLPKTKIIMTAGLY